MAKRKVSLGELGSKFFALMQMNQQTIVQVGELQTALGISVSAEHDLFKRLAKQGFILRLKRGTYLVPEKLPASGSWQPNDFFLVAKFMKIYEADYYIGGMAAFYHHGFIQQIPNVITVYNNKVSGKRQLGKLHINCIKTSKERIVGFETIKLPDNTMVKISNRARTLLDAVYDHSRYSSLPDAYGWLIQYKNDQDFINELVLLTNSYSNNNTIRRIGYFLESLGIKEKLTSPLAKQLKPLKSYVRLDPTRHSSGEKNRKWGVINNAQHS